MLDFVKESEEDKLKEEYLNKHGWIQVEGFKVNVEKAGAFDYEYVYFEKDTDVVTTCWFWKDVDDNDESCFDITDEAIEYVEDSTGETFESYKETQKKIKEKKNEANKS